MKDYAAIFVIASGIAGGLLWAVKLVIENAISNKLRQYAERREVRDLTIKVDGNHKELRERSHRLAECIQRNELELGNHETRISGLEREGRK